MYWASLKYKDEYKAGFRPSRLCLVEETDVKTGRDMTWL